MNNKIHIKIKSYIQPFERVLAALELEAMSGSNVIIEGDCDTVLINTKNNISVDSMKNNLAYWETIFFNGQIPTKQVIYESTATAIKNGTNISEILNSYDREKIIFPNRRCLRYATHGLHEYRGKFFPQLVKALINIADVPIKGTVADPLCGSGTTLVEAVLSGKRCFGIDLNPLSVEITRIKCNLLSAKPKKLEEGLQHLVDSIDNDINANNIKEPNSYFSSLNDKDQLYLTKWFSVEALNELEAIVGAINNSKMPHVKDWAFISLSNILRNISWQKNDDLRVRKDLEKESINSVRDEYIKELDKTSRLLLPFLVRLNSKDLGKYSVQVGDSRNLSQVWRKHIGTVDAVITSPPYATALPYIDTDRLSLSYLNLLARPEHRKREVQMIGNREINKKQRIDFWNKFLKEADSLPDSVGKLLSKIHELNRESDVGFRRRNVPSLLAKYFFDMKEVLRGTCNILKKGSSAFIVIGTNHTIAGGEKVIINTPELITEIGQSVGFSLASDLSMDMLVSRDIFRNNTGEREVIIELRKK